MNGLLLGAWVFWMTSFCALGLGCRLMCRRRRLSGRSCICGRHSARPAVAANPDSGRALPGAVRLRPSRMRAAEARVRALQQRYVEGLLSVEQYERELDKVVGLA